MTAGQCSPVIYGNLLKPQAGCDRGKVLNDYICSNNPGFPVGRSGLAIRIALGKSSDPTMIHCSPCRLTESDRRLEPN